MICGTCGGDTRTRLLAFKCGACHPDKICVRCHDALKYGGYKYCQGCLVPPAEKLCHTVSEVIPCGDPCDVLKNGGIWETCPQGQLFKGSDGKAQVPEDSPDADPEGVKGLECSRCGLTVTGRLYDGKCKQCNPGFVTPGLRPPIPEQIANIRERQEATWESLKTLGETARQTRADTENLSELYKSCIAETHTHGEPVAYQSDHDTLFGRVRELTKAVKNLDTQVGHAKRERVEIRNLVKEAALTEEEKGAARMRGMLTEFTKHMDLTAFKADNIGDAVSNFIWNDWVTFKNALLSAAGAWEMAGKSHQK